MSQALVTGANRGFGLAVATALRDRGDAVIAACRGRSPELDALDVEVLEGVDLTTDAGEHALAHAVRARPLETVVANAGIFSTVSLDALDLDAIRRQFEVNTLGSLRTVRAVLPALREGSRIALISSLAGSIADNGAGGEYGYRISKAALNMAGVSLARDLAPRGIIVASFHPGRLAARPSTLRDDPAIKMPLSPDVADPYDAARELIGLLDTLTPDDAARFMTRTGERIPW